MDAHLLARRLEVFAGPRRRDCLWASSMVGSLRGPSACLSRWAPAWPPGRGLRSAPGRGRRLGVSGRGGPGSPPAPPLPGAGGAPRKPCRGGREFSEPPCVFGVTWASAGPSRERPAFRPRPRVWAPQDSACWAGARGREAVRPRVPRVLPGAGRPRAAAGAHPRPANEGRRVGGCCLLRERPGTHVWGKRVSQDQSLGAGRGGSSDRANYTRGDLWLSTLLRFSTHRPCCFHGC